MDRRREKGGVSCCVNQRETPWLAGREKGDATHAEGTRQRGWNVNVLRRVLKHCGRWQALQHRVQNLPEQQGPVGRALTPDEQQRLFEAAANNPEWEHIYCAATVAANTSTRPVEVKHLRRRDVDLVAATVTIARSKNQAIASFHSIEQR